MSNATTGRLPYRKPSLSRCQALSAVTASLLKAISGFQIDKSQPPQ